LARPGFVLRIERQGFGVLESRALPDANEHVLQPAVLPVSVTVTARPGLAEDPRVTPELVWPVDRDVAAQRPLPTLGHALEEAPGILVQQTTPGQVSPFLRGLTGYQVANLVDGVRFNNSTFRSGPNQYLALLEPSQAERVEAMLGPSGAQYGSDGLGGTIQVLTTAPRFGPDAHWSTHGTWMLSGDSSDMGAGSAGEVGAGTHRLWLLAGASGYRHQDLRGGRGMDSRHVFRRLFDLPGGTIRELTGSRMPDTAWSRAGAHAKLAWRPHERHSLSGMYQRGGLYGVRGYKDLWGGLGRLQSDFRPQTLDFGYFRWEGLGLAKFDSLSARVSFNRQVDGGLRRNLRLTDPITEDENSVRVAGFHGQAGTHVGRHSILHFSGEHYGERVRSERLRNGLAQRPLYPDQATYQTVGLAAQGASELFARRLRAGYGVRFSRIGFATPANMQFGIPDSSLSFRDWTWNASLAWHVARAWGLHAAAGRGFRAPNMNDLGALGLNDLGYEIPVQEALPARPLLSTNAGEGALSKGVPARALGVETLLSAEAGWRLTLTRVEARLQVFSAELADPIVRRTLLFDRSNAPAQLAGIPVTVIPPTAGQDAQGVVTVATPFDPRAVKAFVNDGRAVYRGVESLLRWRISDRWSLRSGYSFTIGRELDPDRNIRRLPPQMGNAALRYQGTRGWWAETALLTAGRQRRLSGGDLDDERIGAARSRRDIADFFQGSRVAPFLDAAGRFTPTGETLVQIQDRVLPRTLAPTDTVRVPLYTHTAGWVNWELRGGWPLSERWTLMGALTNLLDRNYRVHGSGVDGPGFGAYLNLRYAW
jgi:outer membrane receptor protein involved in Fe transport